MGRNNNKGGRGAAGVVQGNQVVRQNSPPAPPAGSSQDTVEQSELKIRQELLEKGVKESNLSLIREALNEPNSILGGLFTGAVNFIRGKKTDLDLNAIITIKGVSQPLFCFLCENDFHEGIKEFLSFDDLSVPSKDFQKVLTQMIYKGKWTTLKVALEHTKSISQLVWSQPVKINDISLNLPHVFMEYKQIDLLILWLQYHKNNRSVLNQQDEKSGDSIMHRVIKDGSDSELLKLIKLDISGISYSVLNKDNKTPLRLLVERVSFEETPLKEINEKASFENDSVIVAFVKEVVRSSVEMGSFEDLLDVLEYALVRGTRTHLALVNTIYDFMNKKNKDVLNRANKIIQNIVQVLVKASQERVENNLKHLIRDLSQRLLESLSFDNEDANPEYSLLLYLMQRGTFAQVKMVLESKKLSKSHEIAFFAAKHDLWEHLTLLLQYGYDPISQQEFVTLSSQQQERYLTLFRDFLIYSKIGSKELTLSDLQFFFEQDPRKGDWYALDRQLIKRVLENKNDAFLKTICETFPMEKLNLVDSLGKTLLDDMIAMNQSNFVLLFRQRGALTSKEVAAAIASKLESAGVPMMDRPVPTPGSPSTPATSSDEASSTGSPSEQKEVEADDEFYTLRPEDYTPPAVSASNNTGATVLGGVGTGAAALVTGAGAVVSGAGPALAAAAAVGAGVMFAWRMFASTSAPKEDVVAPDELTMTRLEASKFPLDDDGSSPSKPGM